MNVHAILSVMTIKKISVEKNEGAGEVVDRILGEPDRALVLVVPKGSALGKSARNFHLIKQETAAAGKKISVESVDEHILALAKNAGMAAGHPLLKERGVSGIAGISDIVPVAAAADMHEEESVEEETAEEETENIYEETKQEAQTFLKEENRFFKKRVIPPASEAEEEEEAVRRGAAWGKRTLWAAVALVIFAAILYGVTVFFGSAKIGITFKKTPWAYAATITADKAVSVINTSANIIPAQIFLVPKNITQLFPASGKQAVSLKARGVITIYNAYSSSPQTLVATTRFVTPDGKIFRLADSVIVPGAKITNGQIVPSSTSAAIVADQPGPAYNVSSTPKLTIPGFKGTPRYDAFYGSIASSTSGGFIGTKAVPTASDIAAAKQKVTDILTSDLEDGITGSYTSNFKILDGATNIQITKLTVNTSTNESGQFSVFGEGTFSAIGFDESGTATTSLKYFLWLLSQSTKPSSTFSNLALNYASVSPNFSAGKLSFSLNAQGSLEPAFSVDDFRGSVAGERISDAKNAVASLPDLEEGTISVWPAWLWQLPSNPNKIQVNVD